MIRALILLETFPSLWQLAIRGSLWSFSDAWPIKAFIQPPSWGLSLFLGASGIWQATWQGSFSVALCVRWLKGNTLWGLSAVWCWHVKRETTEMAQSPVCDSALSPCFHVCLTFLHKHFPLWSPPSGSLGMSPHSQQQTLPWDYSHSSMLQFPVTMLSRELESLFRYIRQGYSVWFSFHSDCHRSAELVSKSLKCFTSVPNIYFNVGIWSLLQFPHSLGADPVLLTLLFSVILPLSYRVLHCSIYYFLIVRYSCLLSAVILQDLLYLEAYSWCICGQICTACSHTPLPFGSPDFFWYLCNSALIKVFPGGSVLKNLPAHQETWVQSREKKMAIHSTAWWTIVHAVAKESDMT